jgi:oxaloacetate decarboxylase alpha subunit
MAHIELVEQTFRDGQQSLWGMRVRTGMVEAAAENLDRGGFRAVEITGSSLMECAVRYSQEDPWEGLDLWRRWMPNSELRAPVCQNRIGTFGMTPDALMDLWVQTLIKHGIDALWV